MIYKNLRRSGIKILGNIPFGTHFCYFYYSKEDLLNLLVPYFREGLENNELCIWIISAITEQEAIEIMRNSVKNFGKYMEKGQIRFFNYKDFYYISGKLNLDSVVGKWIDSANIALSKGYDGLRVTGDLRWLKKRDLKRFIDYETQINHLIRDYNIIAICTYPINKFNKQEFLDISSSHQFALFNKNGDYRVIESYERKLFEEEKERFTILSKGIAHDFNKLLTVIKGYTDLAKMKIEKSSPVLQYLKEISKSIKNSEKIVGQLPKLGGTQLVELEQININLITNELLELFKHLITENIRINTVLDPEIWIIIGNKSKIEQILMNLILNAKDAMPKGGTITIKTENVVIDDNNRDKIQNSRNGKFVCISVKDTGIGMHEDIKKRVFEPFFTTKEPGKGTGLGLSLVKIFTIEHKGWINVRSQLKKGSEFKIYLSAS